MQQDNLISAMEKNDRRENCSMFVLSQQGRLRGEIKRFARTREKGKGKERKEIPPRFIIFLN